jgi:hypothetical protein
MLCNPSRSSTHYSCTHGGRGDELTATDGVVWAKTIRDTPISLSSLLKIYDVVLMIAHRLLPHLRWYISAMTTHVLR